MIFVLQKFQLKWINIRILCKQTYYIFFQLSTCIFSHLEQKWCAWANFQNILITRAKNNDSTNNLSTKLPFFGVCLPTLLISSWLDLLGLELTFLFALLTVHYLLYALFCRYSISMWSSMLSFCLPFWMGCDDEDDDIVMWTSWFRLPWLLHDGRNVWTDGWMIGLVEWLDDMMLMMIRLCLYDPSHFLSCTTVYFIISSQVSSSLSRSLILFFTDEDDDDHVYILQEKNITRWKGNKIMYILVDVTRWKK